MVPDQSDAQKPKGKVVPVQKPAVSPSGKRVPVTTPLQIVMLRNFFYEDAYRHLMQIFLLLLILNIGLMGFGFAEAKLLPSPTYFVATPNGVPLKLIPVDKPNMSDSALLQWAVEASTNAYTFNFVNYRQSLQESSAYFTKNGYIAFLKALKESRNLEAVKKRKLVTYARQTGNAVVLDSSDTNPNLRTNGAYTWLVQIPMLLTYENLTEKFPQNTVLTATIVRQSTLVSEKGVGIHSFVLRVV